MVGDRAASCSGSVSASNFKWRPRVQCSHQARVSLRRVMSDIDAAPTGLARRLGMTDAVVIGLGSMLGAGVFSAFGPATRAAGGAVLLALGLAALVAYCNATSSAQLAALFPQAGGSYVYGRDRPRTRLVG